jgi:hypothetical protein
LYSIISRSSTETHSLVQKTLETYVEAELAKVWQPNKAGMFLRAVASAIKSKGRAEEKGCIE